MYYVNRAVLKRIASALEQPPDEEKPTEILFGNGLETTFNIVGGNEVYISFATVCTMVCSFKINSCEVVKGGMRLIGNHGNEVTVVPMDTEVSDNFHNDHCHVTEKELNIIHDMMIGTRTTDYESESGWSMELVDGACMFRYDTIHLKVRKINKKGRYNYFYSDESERDYILISASEKCPF